MHHRSRPLQVPHGWCLRAIFKRGLPCRHWIVRQHHTNHDADDDTNDNGNHNGYNILSDGHADINANACTNRCAHCVADHYAYRSAYCTHGCTDHKSNFGAYRCAHDSNANCSTNCGAHGNPDSVAKCITDHNAYCITNSNPNRFTHRSADRAPDSVTNRQANLCAYGDAMRSKSVHVLCVQIGPVRHGHPEVLSAVQCDRTPTNVSQRHA
jgi:hypothetical protein